jgi:cytochrome b561
MQRYSRPAIWLHWTVAALIVGNTALGLYAEAAPNDWVRPLIDAHKSLGITVLGLAVLRLSWRLSHAPPPMPVSYRLWERTAANVVHVALYALVFALPLTGWAHDSAWKGWEAHPMRLFWLVPWPRIGAIAALEPDVKPQWHDALYVAHQAAAWAIYALLAAHILGALKHQWLDGHAELQRMGVGGSAGKTLGGEAGKE